ncbi:MAG TPA: hypothetical protein VJ779_16755 [Acetobacteraceae bacterium]|nr:hypothetical protein [Acetobacteraceae bacterium]
MAGPLLILGLLTHLLVLGLGVGGLLGLVPLARGRRAGLGLVLMVVAMSIVVPDPHWHLGLAGGVAYVVSFLFALWLLLGPERRNRISASGAPATASAQGHPAQARHSG